MSTENRLRTWGTVAEALRQKITESGLSFIEIERRTGGAVKRQSVMLFVRGEQDSLRLDKADQLMQVFGLRVIDEKTRRGREATKKPKGR